MTRKFIDGRVWEHLGLEPAMEDPRVSLARRKVEIVL
jgi:hypothetical protein